MNRDTPPTVMLVDDDAGALASLSWLLETHGLRVEAYRSARELLGAYDPELPGCLVSDVRMPEMGGLQLQEELLRLGCQHPIIFVTGYGDVPTCSNAYRRGAFDFVEKPFNEQALVGLLHRAINADSERRARHASRPEVDSLVSALTPREQQVMDLLVEGKSVKQIAVELSVGFPTAARHRSRVLEKMQVRNDVELVRLVLASLVS